MRAFRNFLPALVFLQRDLCVNQMSMSLQIKKKNEASVAVVLKMEEAFLLFNK